MVLGYILVPHTSLSRRGNLYYLIHLQVAVGGAPGEIRTILCLQVSTYRCTNLIPFLIYYSQTLHSFEGGALKSVLEHFIYILLLVTQFLALEAKLNILDQIWDHTCER